MAVRVAINGFGRIGRNVLRAIMESGRKDIEVVAINDLGPVETNAHLFRFDSVHGRFNGEVKVAGDTIDVGRGPIKVTAERDPAKLPHKAMGVDIALECTGLFTAKDKASAHLAAGAKRVLISAPGTDVDLTVVYGVNHQKLEKSHTVVSLPCWELFDEQPESYRREVLGDGLRIGIEAAGGFGWERYLGPDGVFIGMKGFGASAPAPELYKHFGITAGAIVDSVKAKL